MADTINKNIIYLSGEKNIMCIQGTYVDLNLIIGIEDKGNSLNLTMFNGKDLSFGCETYKKSFKNVPSKYSNKYYKYEVEKILEELSHEFDYYRINSYSSDYVSYHSSRFHTERKKPNYRIYNKIETQKYKKFIEINWEKLKAEIVNRWSGIKGFEIKVINPRVIKMMETYHDLNSDNPNVLNNIKKIFGYDISNILNSLDFKGDYYINNNGEMIKL